MTEYNLFCYSEEYNNENSFQQERYRVFNKVVCEKRYHEISEEVRNIIPNSDDFELEKFWKSISTEQWNKLLAIPEAKDFKAGFEYISGQKINTNHTIILDGKEVELSEKSFNALKESLIK